MKFIKEIWVPVVDTISFTIAVWWLFLCEVPSPVQKLEKMREETLQELRSRGARRCPRSCTHWARIQRLKEKIGLLWTYALPSANMISQQSGNNVHNCNSDQFPGAHLWTSGRTTFQILCKMSFVALANPKLCRKGNSGKGSSSLTKLT
jgi:hypothetical protein